MKEAVHQFLLGWGSILLAPMGAWSPPGARITLPPEDAEQAIAHDFGMISGDLDHAIKEVEQARQRELGVS